MNSVSLEKGFNNSKLFFSKNELTKIFSCYSLGVSRGNWKDYSIDFKKNKASFFMYKHTNSSPDCILTKLKKNKIYYILEIKNIKKNNSRKLDDLIIILNRKNLKIVQ